MLCCFVLENKANRIFPWSLWYGYVLGRYACL